MNIIKFEIIDTNHIIIDAIVNGVNGRFIVDTGASCSCIANNQKEKFELKVELSENKITSAGSNNIETEFAECNNVSIGDLELTYFGFFVTDLSHINKALIESGCEIIDGIIGADILIEYLAIINYFNQEIIFKTQN